MGEWLFVLFLLVMVIILAAWAVTIEKQYRRKMAARQKKQRAAAEEKRWREKYIEPMNGWEFPENDGWEYPFPSGEFIRSWYLNMDVMEEGVSELGTRYRILKDNDTGVIYYSDRGGMTPLVKDYRRARYA